MKLDKKCVTILEALNKNPEKMLFRETLYEETKPTQYRGLQKRILELTKSGLIEFIVGYKITDLGKKVALMLKPEDELTNEEIMELKGYDTIN